MNRKTKLIISIIVCQAAGLLATPITMMAIPTWYASLNKPSFTPPNWIFGPVWTLLYLLMGIALYLVWKKGKTNKKVTIALWYFFVQLGLNFIWSLLFFGLQSPLLALIDIGVLWMIILFTILKFYPISRLAAYLLIPYLLWVSFASILNAAIMLLN